MADADQKMGTSAAIFSTATMQVTIAVAVANFALFVAICILYIRSKGYFRGGATRSSSSRRLVFVDHETTDLPRRSLDPAILNSLPVAVFRPEEFQEEGGLECAVCLCEVDDGEEIRLLPSCRHGFHVECIDMWFHSNSTCPLCRTNVRIELSEEKTQIQPLEAVSDTAQMPADPAAVLKEEMLKSVEASTSSGLGKRKEGMLVVDIPRRIPAGFLSSNSPSPRGWPPPISPLPTSRMGAEGIKSPAVPGRMKSLRRMLSRGSPRGCDVELGELEASKCQ